MIRTRLLSPAFTNLHRWSRGELISQYQVSWDVPQTRSVSSLGYWRGGERYHCKTTSIDNCTPISRQFSTEPESSESSKNYPKDDQPSFIFKVLAAVGTILGIGSGAAYHYHFSNSPYPYGLAAAFCEEKKECEVKPEIVKCIPKKCDSSDSLHILDCEEELIRKANFDFERAVMDVRGKVVKYTEAALDASCDAVCLMQKYLDAAYIVIDNDELTEETPLYERSWCCLYTIAKARCEAVQDALSKQMCAWELLCSLREIIEEAKVCKYTECNPLIKIAEEAFECAEQGLLEMKKRMDTLESDSEVVEQYIEVIKAFKKELKEEIDQLPESQKCEIQAFEQETAILINQAYLRVIRLQKEQAQLKMCTGDVAEEQKCTAC